MKRAHFILIFIILFLLGLIVLIGTKGMQFMAMSEAAAVAAPPISTVSSFEAEQQSWTQSFRAVGSIRPVQGVILEAETPGLVKSIHFTNGQQVAEGDLLVQLDVEVERAQLRSAEATVRLAELEYQRAKRLRESGNIPQSDLDRAVADLERAHAEAENIRAMIDRKTIRAPFSGRLGIRQINLGQFVPLGAPIIPIQAYEQVYVNFSLPQQALATVAEGYRIELKADAYPGRIFEGQVTALSPEIDPTTRTIKVQGTLDNPDGALRSGLFVRAEVILPEQKTVTAIPSTAVLYAPYGDSVYRVQEDEESGERIAVQSFIRLGQTKGDFVEVIEGVEPGDQVVSAGAFKLRNRAPVEINNSNQPKPELNPAPDNS
ncbi:MAG: efflux RND transporter periplasmic adaptor subunit [Opitutales bacterium]